METFISQKPLVDNPNFVTERAEAIRQLKGAAIDTPIVGLIDNFAKLPYCFTQQCCYGHFLHGEQLDRENLWRLPQSESSESVEYRIAYVAICVENSERGATLVRDLEQLTNVDPAYVQFGCAKWFWNQQVNSYALQVEPERHKTKDSVTVEYEEALHLQRVRDSFFSELGAVVDSHVRKCRVV